MNTHTYEALPLTIRTVIPSAVDHPALGSEDWHVCNMM